MFFTLKNVQAVPWFAVNQQIAELHCVLTTIVHEDGFLSYALQPNCGKLVVPRLPGRQPLLYPQTNLELALAPEGEAAKLFSRTKSIYLETDPLQQPDAGYVLVMYKDIKYTFRLTGESTLLHDRTFELKYRDAHSITIHFLPEDTEVTIALGETSRIQLAYGNTPDIILTYMQNNLDGSVVVRVRFPSQQELVEHENDIRNAAIATTLLLSFAVGGLLLTLQSWAHERRGIPEPEWWYKHQHNPFGE